MAFEDKTLRCIDCGGEFVWTAGEQAFFAANNLKHEPKRCRACKGKRAARPSGAADSARERVETKATCAACGKETDCAVSAEARPAGVLP